MKKIRIIERTYEDGEVWFVIQERFFLFLWLDAFMYNENGYEKYYEFSSLDEAKKNLCYFDGSRPVDKVVFEHENI